MVGIEGEPVAGIVRILHYRHAPRHRENSRDSGGHAKVNLNGAAPAGGITVTLSSSGPSAKVPPTVTVPVGATTSPVFTITTTAVAGTSPASPFTTKERKTEEIE